MTNRTILASGLLSLVLAAAPLAGAFAQGQPGDPPGRVGRLAEVSGTVSFHTTDETQWAPASINYPVTGGNSFWTEPRSHAAIDVGASRLYMDGATELDVSNVDDQSFIASLAQGAVYLRISPAANGDQYEIDTPRGAVHIVRSGDYEVIAGDQDHPDHGDGLQWRCGRDRRPRHRCAGQFAAGRLHLRTGPVPGEPGQRRRPTTSSSSSRRRSSPTRTRMPARRRAMSRRR